MNNGLIFKRLGAYFIDFLVIFLLNSAIAYIGFINPRYDEYKVVSEEYTQMLDDYYEKKIDINDFNAKAKDMAYDLNRTGYVYIISDVVITFLYFGLFQSITKGQTLGKKLMNIKVVSAKEKDLKWYNYFIRAFILNGVILNLFTFVAVWFSKDMYYKIYNVATNIDYLLMIVIFLMIMLSKDGRGLHDVLASTKVIDVRIEKDKVKEAEVKVIEKDKDEEIREKVSVIEENTKNSEVKKKITAKTSEKKRETTSKTKQSVNKNSKSSKVKQGSKSTKKA